MIFGVRASPPNKRREKRASLCTRVWRSSGLSRAKTVVRLEITTKSLEEHIYKGVFAGFGPMLFAGAKPKDHQLG